VPSLPRRAERRRRRPDLIRLAKLQRALVGLIASYIVAQAVAILYQGALTRGSLLLGAVISLGVLAIWIGAIVITVLMAIASGRSVVLAIIGGLLMILPLIGVVLLLVANGRATATLKREGLRVGILGVPAHEMDNLREGACPNCGYDMHGLSPGTTCPECGRRPD